MECEDLFPNGLNAVNLLDIKETTVSFFNTN